MERLAISETMTFDQIVNEIISRVGYGRVRRRPPLEPSEALRAARLLTDKVSSRDQLVRFKNLFFGWRHQFVTPEAAGEVETDLAGTLAALELEYPRPAVVT